ncbi:MAG: cytochrome P450, partial [Acidimicrobiales bacterium]
MRSSSSSSLGDAVTVDALAGDPFPLVASLRAHEPVAWSAAMDRWLVSRRDLILAVLGDVDRFTTDHDRSPIRATFGPQMLSTDGLEQRRHRGPFAPTFRPGTLRSGCADSVRSRAKGIVAGLEPGDDLTRPAAAMAVGTVLD